MPCVVATVLGYHFCEYRRGLNERDVSSVDRVQQRLEARELRLTLNDADQRRGVQKGAAQYVRPAHDSSQANRRPVRHP